MKTLRIFGVVMMVSLVCLTLVQKTYASVMTEPTSVLLQAAGDELTYTAVSANGGFAWHSQIQSSNLQTDRDVGAASVGMGLIADYQMTHQQSFLAKAEGAGNWLLAIEQKANGGYRWPDYYNSSSNISSDHYTSFDDGAAGIADFLYQLGTISGQSKYIQASQEAMWWEKSMGEGVNGHACPGSMCRWEWSKGTNSVYKTGMGEGTAGIAYAFDVFAQRFPNVGWYKQYAIAAANYEQSRMIGSGVNRYAIAETNGDADSTGDSDVQDTTLDTGYLSGAAGDAFMFLKLYKDLHINQYLVDAENLLSWESQVGIHVTEGSQKINVGYTWPIAIDSADTSNSDTSNATGIEEGNAGIGWVYLQAYKETGISAYRTMAAQAGNWLLHTAIQQNGGVTWNEDADNTSSIIHTSLDNGAPGIGIFLYDLNQVVPNAPYYNAAMKVGTWLRSVAHVTHNGTYWTDQNTDNNNNLFTYYNDPSWHWGSAGIINYFARISGWSTDIPGEQPAL